MIDLGLKGRPRPTKEQIEEALQNCIRARRLSQNEDWLWWKARLMNTVQTESHKVIRGAKDRPSKFVSQCGIIEGVERIYEELETMSANLEAVTSQLEEYARRNQDSPVA